MNSAKEENIHFSGILKQDSPSAYSIITKHFKPSDVARLSQSYQSILKNSQVLESKINRTHGARFNPLPARIIYILIMDGGCKDLEIIDRAILSSGQENLYSLNFMCSLNESQVAESTFLPAFVLDLLRHIHMSEDRIDSNLQRDLLILEQLAQRGVFQVWPKINSLIISSIARSIKLVAGRN